jgi:CheY-like chemotaxis protein
MVLSRMGNDMMQQQQQQTQHMQQEYNKNHVQTHRTVKTVAKRILLVSSEDDVNLALKLALEEGEREKDDEGTFKVDSFNNPILALKNFKNGSYDLLIIDIVMPQMNGFELSEKIRKVDDKVKICFLTAGEIPSKVRFDPFSQGYQDRFIRLPIENEVLIEHIGRIIHS